MITTASKLYIGACVAALAAAAAYGWGTDGGLSGVLTLGLRGGVGNLAGYVVLLGAAGVLGGFGTATSLLRDADPETQAAVARLEAAPPVSVPASPSYWPVVGGFCFVLTAIGAAVSPALFVIGLIGGLLVLLEWTVQVWSERATGDATVNREIRNRLMLPIEIPLTGALVIGVLVISFSRVFLSLSANATSVVAILIGTVITVVAFTMAYKPNLSKDLVAGVLVIGALLAIGGGVLAAAAGPREIEHHGGGAEHESEADQHGEGSTDGDQSDSGDGHSEEGLAPMTIIITQESAS